MLVRRAPFRFASSVVGRWEGPFAGMTSRAGEKAAIGKEAAVAVAIDVAVTALLHTAQQTGRSSSRSRTVATAVRGRHGASKSEGSGILVRLTQPQFVAPPAASHLQYSYIPDTGPDRLHHSVIPHSITPSLHHLISPALGCVAWLLATWVQRSWSWCHGVVEIRSRGCRDRP